MNEVIISKEFFDLNNPGSKGLISSLKKLTARNFNIKTDNNFQPEECIMKIIRNENICFNAKGYVPLKRYHLTPYKVMNVIGDEDYIITNNENEQNTIADAVDAVLNDLRFVKLERNTNETKIKIELALDGKGKSNINTGIGFFDHMLEQLTKHSNINLDLQTDGDLYVDEHHTVEDTGIALGEALLKALGDKKGIKRYGFFLPMDDSIAYCALDLGGRSYLNYKAKYKREVVGSFPVELVEEFFRGISAGLKANIYIKAKGDNDHHKIEAIFKSFAKSLNEAVRFDERAGNTLPTTKGIL